MSVNPQLATLMGLIDELQDQMPEGKYLEAMNALRDLHPFCPRPQPPPVPFVPPNGGVILTPDDVIRHARVRFEAREHNENLPLILKALDNVYLWKTVVEDWNAEQNPPIEEDRLPRTWHPTPRWRKDPHVPEIEVWWMTKTAEEKKKIVQKALMKDYEHTCQRYDAHKNPAPSVCPFVSRHSIGEWGNPNIDPRAKWNCVCGSVNLLVKNWKAHEVSEKHTRWHNEGRRIDPAKRRTMLDKTAIVWNVTKDEELTCGQPSWLDKAHAKGVNFKDKMEIRQGVSTQGYTIAGMVARCYLPHALLEPQSANEWICADLKGKPWEYETPKTCWIRKPTRPIFVESTKRPVDFSLTEIPPIREEPPHYLDARCPVTREWVRWMTAEQYERFIAME